MEKKTSTKKPLSKALRIFYGVGDCAFSLMTNIEIYFFPFFLTNLAMFSVVTAGIIQTVTSGVDTALSWIYGAIIDKTKAMRWGRYRSWLLIAPWVVPFLFAFQFVEFGGNALNAVVITVAFILSHFAWNIPYVANVSMISEAASTPEDRAQLSATRGAWNNMSRVLFPVIGIPTAAFFAGVIGETNKYAAAAFAMGILMAVAYNIHFVMFKGYEESEEPQVKATVKNEAKEDKVSAGDLVKNLFQNGPLLVLLVADVSKYLFMFLTGGIATYFFTYTVQQPELMAAYLLIANVVAVVGSYISKNFAKALSTRTASILFFLIMGGALLLAKLLYPSTSPYVVIALISIAQFSFAVNYALMPALYADCVIYGEWKTGTKAAGWIMGLQNIPLKASILLRGIIISALLASVNFDASIAPELASEALQTAIGNGFTLIPAVFSFASAVLLVVGFKITREKLMQYQEDIDSRDLTA